MNSALKKWQPVFEEELRQVDEAIFKMTDGRAELIEKLANHIISSGGKRLRPLLVILCAGMCGYKGERHINLAAAIELLHTATLLHDDVVDASDMRRGAETANNRWGNEASVLVGDYLLSCAFRLMANDDSGEVLKMLSDASAIISEGEVKQLMAVNNLETGEEEYIEIISAKTARLFAAGCAIGAVITEKEPERKIFDNFGTNLGIAFQIVDDALDYSAKQEELGKTIGDDFREGKITLPVIYAYAAGDEEEKKFWENSLGKDKEEKLAEAISLIKKHNVLERVFDRAKWYARKAAKDIESQPENSHKTAALDLLDFCVNRPY